MVGSELQTKAKKFHIVLIKPSKYDDEGYVISHFRGVLPSNTLACLYSLTEDVKAKKVLGENVEITTDLYDESVHYVNVKKIVRQSRKKDTKLVVGMVGVQSNQFIRCTDLALAFKKEGIDVLIGGFHVSGSMSLFKEIPEEIQALMDQGITIVMGEVEDHWGAILKDAYEGKLNILYNYLDAKPDMQFKPIPMINTTYLKRFAFSNFGTIDCGRGCPFNCSFCTIINVQGHTMRNRDARCIANTMINNYRENKVNYYFFTDDNFARNKNWEQIFDAMIEVKEKEGFDIYFMMQVDVLSYKIPNFVEKAQKAGCTQVFIGMESINPKNLIAADKKQNKAQDYANLIETFHGHNIATHVGFIIGFPFDTPESIQEDVHRLMHEIKVDQASFFMLTPLPGSMDHFHMKQAGAYMDPDFNNYDSFHQTTINPNFPEGTWTKTYRDAWITFYGKENMKRILARASEFTYWRIFMNFIWYKTAAIIEKEHPMITGFFRLKDRTSRRATFPMESRLQYAIRRTKEIKNILKGYWNLFLEMEEIWLATRLRSEREKKIVEEFRALRARIPKPHPVKFYFNKINVFSYKGIETRVHLKWFWARTKVNWRNRDFSRIKLHEVLVNFVEDVKLNTFFAICLMTKKVRHTTSLGNI